MKIKNELLLFLFFCIGFSGLKAQDAVTSAGGDASGIDGIVSYSIGQVIYTTNEAANGSVVQGVQQPYEITIVGNNEKTQINLEFDIFPNPTNSELSLSIGEYPSENLIYQIFDINGKKLFEEKILSSKTNIDAVKYTPGIYFIKIIENNSDIKTFKLIKN